MNLLYREAANVETTDATATPMMEPAMPMDEASSTEVTDAKAVAITCAAETSPKIRCDLGCFSGSSVIVFLILPPSSLMLAL